MTCYNRSISTVERTGRNGRKIMTSKRNQSMQAMCMKPSGWMIVVVGGECLWFISTNVPNGVINGRVPTMPAKICQG